MRKSWYVAGAAFSLVFLSSRPLAAQSPPVVVFNLTGVNGAALGGYYTDPYSGNINGGATIPVICDDFADNSYIPESWYAYETNLNQILNEGSTSSTNTTVKYTSFWSGGTATSPTFTTNQIQTYEAAAILTIDASYAPANEQPFYTYALWELTAGPGTNSSPSEVCAGLPGGGCSSADQTQVAQYEQAAVTDVLRNSIDNESVASYLSNYNIEIFDFDDSAGKGCILNSSCSASNPPQEMLTVNMVSTPEPSSPALLGLDLLGVAGLILFCRRRFGAQN